MMLADYDETIRLPISPQYRPPYIRACRKTVEAFLNWHATRHDGSKLAYRLEAPRTDRKAAEAHVKGKTFIRIDSARTSVFYTCDPIPGARKLQGHHVADNVYRDFSKMAMQEETFMEGGELPDSSLA